MRLKGKNAFITGGAQGIGRGIAELFAKEGASLFLLDRDEKNLEATVADLRTNYEVPIASVVCDMLDINATLEAARQAWDTYGSIDVLINNAGTATREPFTDIALADWYRILDINVNAMFVLSQFVTNRMIAQGIRGSIVNMASKNGLAGSSMLAHYNASKGAVILLTQSMAVELAKHGIRANAVAPGFIDTPLDRALKKENNTLALTARTPMQRMGTVEEVANAFLFLASDEASYITGTTLVVDGGHMANASEI